MPCLVFSLSIVPVGFFKMVCFQGFILQKEEWILEVCEVLVAGGV